MTQTGRSFAWYAIGLALGMATFFALYWVMNGRGALAKVMSGATFTAGSDSTGTTAPNSRGGPQA